MEFAKDSAYTYYHRMVGRDLKDYLQFQTQDHWIYENTEELIYRGSEL